MGISITVFYLYYMLRLRTEICCIMCHAKAIYRPCEWLGEINICIAWWSNSPTQNVLWSVAVGVESKSYCEICYYNSKRRLNDVTVSHIILSTMKLQIFVLLNFPLAFGPSPSLQWKKIDTWDNDHQVIRMWLIVEPGSGVNGDWRVQFTIKLSWLRLPTLAA